MYVRVAKIDTYAVSLHQARAAWACLTRNQRATLRDVATAAGVRSCAHAKAILKVLEDAGYITPPAGRGMTGTRVVLIPFGAIEGPVGR